MRFKRGFRKVGKRRFRRVNRPAKMVTGKDPTPYPLQLLNKGASMYSTLSALTKQVAGLARMINTEDKYIDLTTSSTVSSTGTVFALNGVAQGLTDITRIGNKIRGKDVLCRGVFAINASATNTLIRAILFCDKQYNGADPAVSDVLGSASVLAPLNRDNTERFVILKDQLISLVVSQDNAQKTTKWYKTIPWHMYYSGTDATDASLQTNALCILLLSNEATNVPSFSIISRVKFYDN